MYKHTFADCDTDFGNNMAKWGRYKQSPKYKKCFFFKKKKRKSQPGNLEDPILSKIEILASQK